MKKTILVLLLAFIGLSTANAQVGIGTITPHPSAALDVVSTTKGFLPPRMDTAQRDAISSPAEGLTIYNITNGCIEFWNATNWISACNGSVVSVIPSGPCQGELVEFTFNGLTYQPIDVQGQCWLDRNLGAVQVATAVNDQSAYGNYYQWGRASDGHEIVNSPLYNTVINSTNGVANFASSGNPWDGRFILRNVNNNDNWVNNNVSGTNNLWQPVSGVNNPCPNGFRVPTESEWNTVSGPAPGIDWNNSTAAYNSPLKLTATGLRQKDNGNISNEVGNIGRYWSSTTTSSTSSRFLFLEDAFGGSGFMSNGTARAMGYSIRCIKD